MGDFPLFIKRKFRSRNIGGAVLKIKCNINNQIRCVNLNLKNDALVKLSKFCIVLQYLLDLNMPLFTTEKFAAMFNEHFKANMILNTI